ncbi:ATPase [Caloramator sp. E03]|uniref:ATPase n=1 Tax=Caloramator sp. E03 TaxID=2576307 RepID=UPI001110EA5C|nr:ATPase [Caloramator sp. E03]QCX32300.1 ATPase [Caloramator sp. E03]
MYSDIIYELENKLNKKKQDYFIKKGRMDNLIEQKKKIEAQLKINNNKIDNYEKVKILLQNTSQFAREQSKKQIEYIITQCLQYIFDPSMEFKIDIVEKSNRIEAEFFVVSNINGEQIVTKPQDSRGGGVVDIISLAIRIAMIQIHNPKIDGPLILDEPAKHVSDEYIVNVADFIKQISTTFKRQVIMVTHNNHLLHSADVCYKVTINDGISTVELINLT